MHMVEERKSKIKNQKKIFKNQYIPVVSRVLFIIVVVSITCASDNRPSKKKKFIPYLKNPVMVQKIPRKVLVGSRYSRMDQLKFVEDSL